MATHEYDETVPPPPPPVSTAHTGNLSETGGQKGDNMSCVSLSPLFSV